MKNIFNKKAIKNALYTVLCVVRNSIIAQVSLLLLTFGNFICYMVNDRILQTPTNIVAILLIAVNFIGKRKV
tara:strand:- start:248 stop:463 length:216 start_codon:yes stop_codon:yes gene_type:complete